MLAFQTTQITAFKTSMEVIDSLVSDVNLEVSPDGIRVRETNRTNKLFISVNFDANNFDTYECTDTFNVGIELSHLVNILKPNLHYDVIKFNVLTLSTAKITLESFIRKEIKTVKINLLQGLPNTSGNIADSVYSHSVVLNSELLLKYCKDINRNSERIKIKLNRRELILSSDDDMTEYLIAGNKSTLTITTEDKSKTYAEVTLAIRFILLACKCCMISELVTLFLDRDNVKPTIRFNLGSLGVLNMILF